ncbi:MerR family transcriptional regulator [Desulfovibrio sp. OttesenSCG-928-A18]|nr:MerR family transcriptional regulator [Desulfovibrio sp. OttesenSCG-928-A18]
MKKKKYLSSGEFAGFCRTTKETLFHYDREDLLKPSYVSENGYRYYAVEQIYDFDMISTFKETGSSLKEIREYMNNKDAAEFLEQLEDKQRIVKREKARLAQRELMLRDMAAGTREALDFPYDTMLLLEQEEERLEIVPTAASPEAQETDFAERFTEYINFYRQQKRTPRSPFGLLLEKEDVEQGLYLERYFFSRATRATPRSMLHLKPAGRYAVLAHKGDITSQLRACAGLLRQIKAAGLRLAGNCYYYDMMSYVFQDTGGSYRAKFCMEIAREG